MRVLWFSVTPSLFNPRTNSHNGGGWIASLEQIVRSEQSIQLGVAFNFPDSHFRYNRDGVIYYPMQSNKSSWIKKWLNNSDEEEKVRDYLRIIDDFNPDLIQIFGSENDFGVLCRHTRIPVVMHMQGCIPPYHNALFPVWMNPFDFIFCKGLSLHQRFMGLRSEQAFHNRAEQEIKTIQSCHYFMGRTEWDKGLINLFNPNATYFHCEEALRDSFMNNNKQWKLQESDKVRIISVISTPWYKGMDLILKTSRLLKRFTDLDFEWQVYGVRDIRFYEYKYKIKAKDVNVKIMGTASKEDLVNALCSSTYYVHPSYIDNSPNSICEAQLLGVPVLATHVGGISSLVKDGKTGILFPANAPYTLANLINKLQNNRELLERLSKNSIDEAQRRHNPIIIRDTILTIYKTILKCNI